MNTTPNLLKLSAQQHAEYDEQGFVIVPEVFPIEELRALDEEMDRLAEEKRLKHPEGEHTGWIMSLGLASPQTRDFAQDERILSLIEDIVRPGIAIYSAKLATKMPRSAEVCHWHQDDAYYVQNSLSDTRCSIWAPLQDAHEDNGCMKVVPGSHKGALQEHAHKDWGTCRLSMDEASLDLSRAIPVPVRAGDMVIFSARLWHSSAHNDTDQIRRAFIVSYQEATVQGGNGAQWKILRPAE